MLVEFTEVCHPPPPYHPVTPAPELSIYSYVETVTCVRKEPLPSDHVLLEFAENLRSVSAVQDKWRLFDRTLKSYGFKAATYGLSTRLRTGSVSQEVIYYSSHAEDFVSTYIDEGLADHDYAVLHCAKSSRPALWSGIKYRYPTARSRMFREITEDFGIRDGLVIPFHDRHSHRISGLGLCFEIGAASQETALLPDTFDTVLRIATLFDEEMRSPQALRQTYRLSPREIDCLTLICLGRINKEIADALNLADKTVEHYIRNAARKLRARNKHHAAAKAVMLGVVAP